MTASKQIVMVLTHVGILVQDKTLWDPLAVYTVPETIAEDQAVAVPVEVKTVPESPGVMIPDAP
jgi:hypothetical protein